MGSLIVLTGQVFGRLTVRGRTAGPQSREFPVMWDCVCACGEKTSIAGSSLRTGLTKSCGCLNDEKRRDRNLGNVFGRTHGEGGDKTPQTAEYQVWTNIKQRCLNPKNPGFSYYGGRGITLCAEWAASYESFLAAVGRKPTPHHSIDRIDVNGNYEPGNVRWATPADQNRNKRPYVWGRTKRKLRDGA